MRAGTEGFITMGKTVLNCRNTRNGTSLGHRISKADSYFTRLFGLLPKSHLEEGEGLWIVPCNSIHSVGMKFVFDAVFLAKDLTVVAVMSDIPKWRLSPVYWKAHSVLELPASVIAQTDTQVGDVLSFEPV